MPIKTKRRQLHADYYGKHGKPIPWQEYRRRCPEEMQGQKKVIQDLARRVRAGETLTLLCSSACVDERHCHRTLLKELIAMESSAARAGKQ